MKNVKVVLSWVGSGNRTAEVIFTGIDSELVKILDASIKKERNGSNISVSNSDTAYAYALSNKLVEEAKAMTGLLDSICHWKIYID